MVLFQLFPSLTKTFEIERMVSTSKELLMEAQSQRRSAVCPSCGQVSQRVHSHYVRHLWEQPCAGQPVQLVLHVQRFRCLNPGCRRCTFTEPLEDLAERSARRTPGQKQALVEVGLALGETAGIAGGQCLDPPAGAAAQGDAPSCGGAGAGHR